MCDRLQDTDLASLKQSMFLGMYSIFDKYVSLKHCFRLYCKADVKAHSDHGCRLLLLPYTVTK